jgi:polyhydroxybutyrate depolymerase
MDPTTRTRRLGKAPALGVVFLALACSESATDFDAPGSGGTAGSAAGAGSGGAPQAGAGGAGGATSGSGGGAVSGTAGTVQGGAGAGQTGTGGASGSGAGQSAGGAAGSAGAVAGAAGSGGRVEPTPTEGCDAATFPASDETYTIDVDGIAREYIVSLPVDYDASTPHKLVFAWHGRTGTAEQIAGRAFGGAFYGLKADSRGGASTIFVAGQGLGTEEDPEDTGWPNTDGRDVAFVRAMLEWLGQSYCIDQERIFSIGMSYGGIMSNTLGCEMGDTFRAIAPIASAFFNFGGGGSDCVGPVAAWLTHGTADDVLPIENGEEALDLWLTQNNCGTATTPVEPSPCVAYEGCDGGYPVHWCVHAEGHIVPDFSADGAWTFFSQF